MQETPNKLYTYEDYLKIDDDNQYELIGGELILVPSPKSIHQIISLELAATLRDYVRKNKLGRVITAPLDVVLSETDKPQPDILFISTNRLDIITEDNIKGAPDLVIEILSPSTASRDKVQKSKMYYNHGVKEYWIVDPSAKAVQVFTPGEKNWNLFESYDTDGVLTSPLLPGLEINLKNVF
ncbi:hypothetical protein DCCM_2899 [Desulfocucumis palustris]|uniref:Putative restriction endonuclease domain-containing protein n=1 Tax=Desulfocucumis palustris TaxID=1898651 RepID=A0A2L2XC28_9FIRM|nr:Uma2 family endonuclease [Desulfocucumis palustris]GBF33788.1 hypothetical protein DCCM_2899 [Desulfocucumis palustris]